MKAIQFKEYGKPEVFQFVDVQIPPLKPGGVLVQVKAAGVNLEDTARRYGQYLAKTPLPFIPGTAVELFHYIGEGKLKLIIGETIPLKEAKKAHELLEACKTTGKLVLIP